MKLNKFLWSLSALAALGLASCSSDKLADEPTNPNDGETVVHYMTINIAQAPESRGDQGNGDPDGALYEYGETNENAVAKVRFYFFDANGNGVVVGAAGKNWYEWDAVKAGTVPTTEQPNVEKLLSAKIILSTKVDKGAQIGSTLPTQMITIVNPESANLPTANVVNAATLRTQTKQFTATTGTDNGFVMATSVYKDASGAESYATPILAENLQDTEENANLHPVIVYVERNVAKARMAYATGAVNDDGKLIVYAPKGNTSDPDVPMTVTIGTNNYTVVADITGWNVTADTDKGYLSKSINKNWADGLFGTVKWNWSPYNRCFWAKNPTDAAAQYHSYNDIGTSLSIGTGTNYKYLEENACVDDTSNGGMQATWPTQIIIAATLMYKNGTDYTPLTIVEYSGVKLASTDALITDMVNRLPLYKVSKDGTSTSYTKITAAEVELVTAYENGNATPSQNTQGRYYVELALTDAAKAYTWSTSDEEGSTEYAPTVAGSTNTPNAKVTEALAALGHAKVWNTGQTYYFFKINHLNPAEDANGKPDGTKAGTTGVVRNHIYDITVNKAYGLGTPVYRPSETIYPETPEDEDTYVSAELRILSWRVVSQNVNLGQ